MSRITVNGVMRAALLAAVLIPMPALAQSPDQVRSLWQGTLVEDSVEVPVHIELRVNGDAVQGIIFIDHGEQYSVPGKITGNAVEFTSKRLRETDRDVAYLWTGQISGDLMTFSVVAEDREGAVREFTFTRQVP